MTKKLTLQLILPVREDLYSREKAKKAQAFYEAMGFGVNNPHEIAEITTKTNGYFNEAKVQVNCLGLLSEADLAVVLPGWKNSEGCTTEIIFATKHGIPLYLYKSNIRVYFNSHEEAILASKAPEAGKIIIPDDSANGGLKINEEFFDECQQLKKEGKL